MTTVHAYAAHEANGKLEPFEYELGPLGPHDVDVQVTSCGICHSDLSMLENSWGMTQFPFVPGHEVVGRITQVGEHVTHLNVGDTVGLGWHSGYCMHCQQCMGGDHNMCTGATSTIIGRHGGFADRVRAQAASVIKLPEGVDPAKAGPMFCGGITVFNPMLQFNLSPTDHVGVIGVGGLGHLALQFANAWGCHVTAFTSPGKQEQALQMGAHETLNSRDPKDVEQAAGRFDLLLCTINVKQDWNAYLNTLKSKGRLHMLGVVPEPLDINVTPLLFLQRSVSSSPVGSPASLVKMLDFSARHNIEPVTEHFPMKDVNDAMDHLRAGKARYRIVLDA